MRRGRELRSVRQRLGLGLGLLMPLLSGCGTSEFELAPVSGRVQLDGVPLAGARVVFEPHRTGEQALRAGPGSWGLTDDDGKYTLETLDGDAGAVVGPHRVTISSFQGETDRTTQSVRVIQQERVPERYQVPGMLNWDVPAEGTNEANFDLQSLP